MKKILILLLAMLLLGMFYTTAIADPAMPLNGTWVVLDEFMTPGNFFPGPYTWNSTSSTTFTITDLYVASDQFEVYDNAVLVLTTPSVPDWDTLGSSGPFVSPPYTTDPDVALASGFFSSGVIGFAPGAHSITIRDIHIPPVAVGGGPFSDGTVAFKAAPVPEPMTMLLLGSGLLGLWGARRKFKK